MKSEPVLAEATVLFCHFLLQWISAFHKWCSVKDEEKSQSEDKRLDRDERGVKEKEGKGNKRKGERGRTRGVKRMDKRGCAIFLAQRWKRSPLLSSPLSPPPCL